MTAVSGTGPYTVTIAPAPLHAELGIRAKPNHYPEFDVLYLARNIRSEDLTVDFSAGTTSNNGSFGLGVRLLRLLDQRSSVHRSECFGMLRPVSRIDWELPVRH